MGKVGDAPARPLDAWAGHSGGYSASSLVDHERGSVHTWLGLNRLEPGGRLDSHFHSYEEGVYILEGEVLVGLEGNSYLLRPGDYAVFPIGLPHAWRNAGSASVQWLDMLSPQPRQPDRESDLFFSGEGAPDSGAAPNLRDPSARFLGHFSPDQLPPPSEPPMGGVGSGDIQGVSIKMMIDRALGAEHMTMFIVRLQPGGQVTIHDHPLEESYFLLSGECEIVFNDKSHMLKPGDVGWAGVGTTHGFFNRGQAPVSWLETQAPQPPPQQAFRSRAYWERVAAELGDR